MARPYEAPTPSAGAPLETGEVLPVGGGYRLLKRLGQGAFGEVWGAAAPGGVEVAVKLISRTIKPAEARRELEALEIIKRLRHQNLLSLQAFFSLPDRLIIVLELADTSLRARLHARPDGQGLPPADLLRYTLEAAEALDYLHDQKVQHRDIKPDNLLLLGSHAKVADFGLARVLETVLLQSASQAGTPAYMAPEVWSGKLSPHSDQYSLALCYAELRLGRFPLGYDNLANLMYAHMVGTANLDPLPAAEQAVLQQALAKEPGKLFPNCTGFAGALIATLPVAEQARPSARAKEPIPKSATPRREPVDIPTDPPSSHHTDPGKQASLPQLPEFKETKLPLRRLYRARLLAGGAVTCVIASVLLAWLMSGGSRGRGDDPVGPAIGKDQRVQDKNKQAAKDKGPGGEKMENPSPATQAATSIENKIGMQLRLIPKGKFRMGSPDNEKGHFKGESPLHEVVIGKAFYMAVHKTTQEQFRLILNREPSWFSAKGGGKDKLNGDTSKFPVETITFFAAIDFCNRLSEREELRPSYRLGAIKRASDGSIDSAEVARLEDGTGYRLPTEAEWEYCARGGTKSAYSFGEDETKLVLHAWYDANSGGRTHRVGEKEPNPWKLYDMGGLVWEWCEDVWHDNYEGAARDGSAWMTGGEQARRVVRGGSWDSVARFCRSAGRDGLAPGVRFDHVGFRVVRVSP
jgi:formylglycine-generating enzyme required for sulfatase activity